MIRVRIHGERVAGMVDKAWAGLRPRAANAVLASVLILEGEMKTELSRPGRGRVYRSGKRRSHRASAPGDAPAVDSGRLRNSIAHTGPEWAGDEVSGEVGTNVSYARALENGTSKMAARPFARPALERARPMIMKRLRDL